MLLLTVLALEGMGRLAYYAAYGQWYGGGRPAPAADSPAANLPAVNVDGGRISHPFYGFSQNSEYGEQNAMPPRQRRADTVVIGLLGGSVAAEVEPFFQRALTRWFAANELPRQPAVLKLAGLGAKQPQQAMVIANTLLLGGEFDLIVNLDGLNETTASVGWNFDEDLFPFFPLLWKQREALTGAEALLVGHIGVLRREQERQAAVRETSPLRRSALFGLAHRYRQERTAAQIIQLNYALAATAANYSLEKHGPRPWLHGTAALAESTRFWYRGSTALAHLAALAGADYYHFLQPNQYVPDSKPLSQEERDSYYDPDWPWRSIVTSGYPLLQELCRDLQSRGVPCFDLTGIFADRRETLYKDVCCHLNDRGNELLAAAMLRRLEPALRRLGRAKPAAPLSPLAAARLPAEFGSAGAPGFQVSLTEAGQQLRYVRAGCASDDIGPLFFLHLTPRHAADLPPDRREQGFVDITFGFTRSGGRFQRGQCVVQFPLPDYPIATLRTGQQTAVQGELWSTQLIIPVALAELRADYAALSPEEPLTRDYFDLYLTDNRLLYLRESCAAADTAAPFFLHIIPADAADLPPERQEAGFAHAGFAFARHGGPFDGKCLASVSLPDYPVIAIRTGQRLPDQGDLWAAALTLPADLAELRADYAALAAVAPVVRDYFDLYDLGNRLVYLRESCAAADTAADFFLHLIPADIAALPADRQEAGFAHGGFEFAHRGGHFDGKCLAAVPLPDYPLAGLRTGQYIPGQGELWSVQLFAAP